MGFLTQWKMYLDQLPAGPDGNAYRGEKLNSTIFERVSTTPLMWEPTSNANPLLQMSSEQLAQLYEVMHVTRDVWKPVEPANEESQEIPNSESGKP